MFSNFNDPINREALAFWLIIAILAIGVILCATIGRRVFTKREAKKALKEYLSYMLESKYILRDLFLYEVVVEDLGKMYVYRSEILDSDNILYLIETYVITNQSCTELIAIEHAVRATFDMNPEDPQ